MYVDVYMLQRETKKNTLYTSATQITT